MSPLVTAIGLEKRYRLGRTEVLALRGVDLRLEPGEFVVVAGPSGSGKSTLLNLLGCLDDPDAGSVVVEGRDVSKMSASERTRLRRRRLGFVFQSFHLVPVLSAFENVEYPLLIDGVPRRERRARTTAALVAVGLQDRLGHKPDQLSGGERQRVAVARALVHDPVLVLADEPTANLDSATGGAVVDLLTRLNAERHVSFLLATHDPAIMRRAPRVVRLADGRVVEDGTGAAP
jgi:putative ABC transport system ATP-binding protein